MFMCFIVNTVLRLKLAHFKHPLHHTEWGVCGWGKISQNSKDNVGVDVGAFQA